MSLRQIAGKYKTDKFVQPGYLENYERYFGPLRKNEVRLLELGIKDGGSLNLWREYFPRGIIVGLDINPVHITAPDGRIRTYTGPQQDTGLLDNLARENAPSGFDIIIDDCAHIGVFSRISFWHLFENHLKSGGIYVVEDWGTGYWWDWVDGIALRTRHRHYNQILFQAIRAAGRLQRNPLVRSNPLTRRLASLLKTVLLHRQYKGHDFGMVGFVKELVDEMGMPDITHPDHGVPPLRHPRFKDLHVLPGHVVVVKA